MGFDWDDAYIWGVKTWFYVWALIIFVVGFYSFLTWTIPEIPIGKLAFMARVVLALSVVMAFLGGMEP